MYLCMLNSACYIYTEWFVIPSKINKSLLRVLIYAGCIFQHGVSSPIMLESKNMTCTFKFVTKDVISANILNYNVVLVFLM